MRQYPSRITGVELDGLELNEVVDSLDESILEAASQVRDQMHAIRRRTKAGALLRRVVGKDAIKLQYFSTLSDDSGLVGQCVRATTSPPMPVEGPTRPYGNLLLHPGWAFTVTHHLPDVYLGDWGTSAHNPKWRNVADFSSSALQVDQVAYDPSCKQEFDQHFATIHIEEGLIELNHRVENKDSLATRDVLRSVLEAGIEFVQ